MALSVIMKAGYKKSILLLVLFGWVCCACAQNLAHRDSVIKVARTDAKSFRLDNAAWKKYRHKLPYTSDYFKPTAAAVKDTALLHDSVYVDTYRQEAFKTNKHRRTAGHYVLIGGEIVVGVAAAFITAVIIFIAPKMGG
ncbi:hypothetical protein [Mucilaginibacter celer]|nr:hypothetical protein [Mucilaginibacter celer]